MDYNQMWEQPQQPQQITPKDILNNMISELQMNGLPFTDCIIVEDFEVDGLPYMRHACAVSGICQLPKILYNNHVQYSYCKNCGKLYVAQSTLEY